jgi:radical SAM superfamily enzyme YgiQ (UPF0313 family)
LKVLLINPPHWKLTGIHNNQNPGLGLLYLASQLQNHDVRIVDAEATRMELSHLHRYVKAYDPNAVLVTSTTLSFQGMVKTCKLIRNMKPDTQIVVGGPHVTTMPHKSLALTGANCAVVGEGETIIEKALTSSGVLTGSPFLDLDVHLPRDKHDPPIPSEFYVGNDPVYELPETTVMWERGCPHECVFCSTRAVHGRVMRRRSIPSIIAELKELKALGIRSIFVYDDELVGVNKEQYAWLMELCDTIIREGLSDLIFKSQGRCNGELVTDELLTKMKQAGFKALMMGCESGSQKVLDAIKKHLTIEDIETTIPRIKKAGIETFTYWMIGNREETSEDARLTLELIKRLRPNIDHKHVTILNPLPGAPIYQEALENGWILSHNFNFWSQHGHVIMEGPWLSEAEILAWERRLIDA